MAARLSIAERRILEAAQEAVAAGTMPAQLTDVVRRALGQIRGPEFRRGVASLAERGLLRATCSTKQNGEVGRVVIEQITTLGRSVVRPPRPPRRPLSGLLAGRAPLDPEP